MQQGTLGLLATFLPLVGVLLTIATTLLSSGSTRVVVVIVIPAITALLAWQLMETAFEVGHMLAVVIYILFFLLLSAWYTGLVAWFVYRGFRKE